MKSLKQAAQDYIRMGRHLGFKMRHEERRLRRFVSFMQPQKAPYITTKLALGGARWAHLVAALAAVPFCLGGSALMHYVSFDYLCWVLTAYCTLRLLKSADPRWWSAIGGGVGLGMLSKYSMPFFVAGLIAGILFTMRGNT